MWLLWLRGSESMFPVKLRSSLAFFKTHCWPSTCLLSHQTSQRFIFSCFYRLCNLNVFGFRIVDSKGGSILTPGWWEFWRRAAHDLLKVILECCIGGPWTLNIKFMIKIGANLSSFIEAKKEQPMSTIRRNCFAKRIVAKVVATVSPRMLETSFMAQPLSDLSSLFVKIRDSIPKHEYLQF